MYFIPFELRKVWSFRDVNWAPLSLSSSSGIPYPVNSLLVWTGAREFHNRPWPFSKGSKSTNDYIESLGETTVYFCYLFSKYKSFKDIYVTTSLH